MNLVGILYVEENTEEANRVIELMDRSGLPYQIFHLTKEETNEHKRDCDRIPKLMSWPGIFHGLESIEWYSKCYGVSGPLHRSYCQQTEILEKQRAKQVR